MEEVGNSKSSCMRQKVLVRQHERLMRLQARQDTMMMMMMRKKLTFHDSTTGFPAK